jgi:hypothetical protein
MHAALCANHNSHDSHVSSTSAPILIYPLGSRDNFEIHKETKFATKVVLHCRKMYLIFEDNNNHHNLQTVFMLNNHISKGDLLFGGEMNIIRGKNIFVILLFLL